MNGDKSRKVHGPGIILPFFISLIPFLILQAELRGFRFSKASYTGLLALEEANSQRKWLDEVRQVSKQFQVITDPKFWIREVSQRFLGEFETFGGRELLSTGRIESAFHHARTRCRLPGVPPFRIWAFRFPEGANGPASLVTLKGFETTFRTVFSGVFRETLLDCEQSPSQVEAKSGILKTTFGEACTPDLFSRGQMGRPFFVIFQQRHSIAIWNVLKTPPGKNTVVYFMVFQIASGFQNIGLRAAIRNWGKYVPPSSPRMFPAFLPFPVTGRGGTGAGIFHPALQRPGMRRLLEKLRRRMTVSPRRPEFQVGEVSLFPREFGESIEMGGFRFFLTALDPIIGYVGVLVSRIPRPPCTILEGVANVYGCCILFCWLPTFAFLHLRGRIGGFRIRTSLYLWFIGLIAIPITLMATAGIRLSEDLSATSEFALRDELEQTLQRIDTGSMQENLRFLQACRNISLDPDLGPALDALDSLDGGSRERAIDRLLEEKVFQRWPRRKTTDGKPAGDKPSAVMILGGPQAIFFFPPDSIFKGETQWSMKLFHLVISLELVRMLGGNSGSVTDSPDAPPPSWTKITRFRNAMAMSYQGFYKRNRELLGDPNVLHLFQAGSRHSTRYFNQILSKGKVRNIIFLFWDQEPVFRDFLEKEIRRVNSGHPKIRFAAFKDEPQGLEPVAIQERDEASALAARKVRRGTLFSPDPQHFMVALRSTRMPGFILTAVTTFQPVESFIFFEKVKIASAILLLLVVTFIGGTALSRWLASPLVRMTAGLDRIASGDLEVRVRENRADQIGDASRTLDQMTDWLRERTVMSRFVAPQVLEVVGQGDFDKACQPRHREVVLMVSDVRSFTTMSEAHPPKEIFALINSHLQVMTRAIQKHGGAIDRFIGDAIQAVFYPGKGESMVRRALFAASDMMDAHRNLNDQRQAAGRFPYFIGIGIEIGEVVTGVLGDPLERLDFTVLGEPFKRANDLEAASKKGKARLIICSDKVRKLAGEDFPFIPLEDPSNPNCWELTSREGGVHGARQEGEASPGLTSREGGVHGARQEGEASSSAGTGGESPTRPCTGLPLPETKSAPIDVPEPVPAGESKPPSGTGARSVPPLDCQAGGPAPASPQVRGSPSGVSPSPEEAIEGPTPQVSPGAARQSGGQTHLHAIWQLLFLLVVPPALLIYALWANDQRDLERWRNQHLGELKETVKLAANSIDPKTQATLFLRKTLATAEAAGLDPSHGPQRIFEFLAGRGKDFQKLFPGISCSMFLHCPQLETGVGTLGNRLGTRLFPTIGRSIPFNRVEWRDFLAYYKTLLYGVVDPYLDGEFRRSWTSLLKIDDLRELGDTATDNLIPVSPFGKTRYLLVHPFFDPAFFRELRKGPDSNLIGKDLKGFTRATFRGGAAFLLDPETLTFDLAVRLLMKNLQSHDCKLAVVQTDVASGNRKVWTDDDRTFLRYPELKRWLETDSPVASQSVSNDWLITSEPVLRENSFLVVAARPVPTRDSPFKTLLTSASMLTLFWFLLGTWMMRKFVFRKEPLAISVFVQLAGMFLLLVVPAIAFAALVTERSFQEARLREEASRAQSLAHSLRALDEARDLYLGWANRVTTTLARRKGCVREFHELEKLNKKEMRTKGTPFLKRFYVASRNMGYPVYRILLTGPGRFFLSFNTRGDEPEGEVADPEEEEDQKNNSLVMSLMNEFSTPPLKQLNPEFTAGKGLAGETENLLLGAGIEEFRALLMAIIPPERGAEMLLAPKAMSDMVTFSGQECFLRTHLWYGKYPRYSFQTNLNKDAVDFQLFNALGKSSRSCGPFGPRYNIGFKRFPGVIYWPPMVYPTPRDENVVKFKSLTTPPPPEYVDLAILTGSSQNTWSKRVDRNGEEFLMTGVSGNALKTNLLIGEIPIGKILEQGDAVRDLKRVFLAFILLLSVILAWSIARRFLVPVFALSDAAREIMGGNFKTRLEEGTGGEFGRLAKAFNSMAAGVEEGRLLSRFVSESVRVAASDRERGDSAQKGENIEVTVLFAGIADFKHLMATIPPGTLVHTLNRFLETMARTIRGRKGDIDKFIGEKVLAVFHPSRLGGPREAAGAALQAAVEMRRRMAEIPELGGNPLGIGIVSGPVLAGIMGTDEVRLEYTVIGDTVNLASRLGDISLRVSKDGTVLPDYHGSVGGVVVAEGTFRLVGESSRADLVKGLRRLKLPPIKGKTRSVEAYLFNPADETTV